ncbi:7TM diverse intracellular signaling domain-containing protein [Oligoflexus tunisiensis]|uniref:7TM diverse intracellular signaling domain-containing protein n=1 Tax=Oligoflexus tunisiensis TaxID=708132 RepID=UPI00114CD9D9|nr:7TM diverse intracellular signaling domain-containing protein [Oligoflexus tunisiensis]
MMRLWFFIFSALLSFAVQAQSPDAVIDLHGRDFNEPYRLVEEGRFYWNELLEPGQEPEGEGIAAPPKVWNGWSVPQYGPIPNHGYATYEFRLRGFEPSRLGYQFGLRTAASAFRMTAWPQGRPEEAVSANSGRVGTSAETMVPSQRYAIVSLQPKSPDEVWIIRIQVSNYFHKRAGLWQKPFIGSGNTVEQIFLKNEQKDMFSLGFMMLMTFYCLMLYVRRREDMESLTLAATSAMAFVRTLSTGTIYYSSLAQDSVSAFILQFRLEYITLGGGPLSYMLFVHFAFHQQSNNRLAFIVTMGSLFNIVMAMVMPMQIFTGLLPLYQLSVSSMLIYFYVVLFRAWRAGHEGAGTALLGAIVVSITAAYDVLVNLNIVPQPYTTVYGVGIFLLIQSQVTAGRFATAFRTAERLQRELRSEVERQTAEIRSLMENVPQGIFILQSDLRIQGNYSLYLERLLGSDDLAGKDGIEVLFTGCEQSNEQKSMAMSALIAAMNEESLVWSFNESCLPRELRRRHRSGETHILEIDWHPIINARDQIERVLVTVRNVTRVKELEAESRRHQVDFDILTEIIQAGRADVLRFLEQGRLYMTRCQALLQDEQENMESVASKIFLHIHTLKGLARALGLRTMTTQIHDLEQELSQHQKTRWQSWTRSRAAEVVKSTGSVFAAYQSIMEEKLHWGGEHGGEMLGEGELKDIDREIRRLPPLASLPAAMLPLVKKVDRIVTRLAYHEVYALQDDLKREARSLAMELGKPTPEVIFEGEGILLNRTAESLLRSALVHLVRNSLDHGLESTDERRLLKKKIEGRIQLTFEHHHDRLRMRYADDGRGLNLEAIRARALNLGLLTPEQQLPPEKMAEFIFESGFTTKTRADMISGRGIGMDAVRHLFEEAGGRIWIELPRDGSAPFVIRGELPASLYRLTDVMQKGA